MSKTVGIVYALLASTAFAKGGGAAWDEKGASEIKSIVQKGYEGFGKGDASAVLNASPNEFWGGVWDYDVASQPAAMKTKADLQKFFDDIFAAVKQMHATLTWKTTALECKASGALGVCYIEGEQTVTIPKMPPMTVWQHNTEVLAKDGGTWKWIHHNASFAKTGPFPPHVASFSGKSQGFGDMGDPSMPGVQMIPIWMNPANGYAAAIMKATQTVVQPRHMHPYPFTFAVLSGSIVTSDASGKDVEYGPGSVVYRAPGEPHKTTIKAGAVVFGVMAGPMATLPVDASGQPQQHAAK